MSDHVNDQDKSGHHASAQIPLRTLIERWAQIAMEVERGYTLTFDDFLNDLDLRHRIAKRVRKLVADVSLITTLDAADDRFRASTLVSNDCLWGEENATDEGWTPEREWYYYRTPKVRPTDW